MLNTVKKLAGTKWGENAPELKTLYLNAVRSIMEYRLPIQNLLSTTCLNNIDAIQNKAIRVILGTMKSSPIAAGELLAGIEPLHLTRKKAQLITIERYRRLNINDPLHSMAQQTVHNRINK
ncbi:unnamed protein product, partial [Lymnaea stagnalis]